MLETDVLIYFKVKIKKKKLKSAGKNQKANQSLQVMISLLYFTGLKNFISSLTSSTDIRDLLSCLSSDLQTFVIKV